jgi:hypothetical protein
VRRDPRSSNAQRQSVERAQQQQPRPFNPYEADKMKAKQSGETSKMPPQGKEALKIINQG